MASLPFDTSSAPRFALFGPRSRALLAVAALSVVVGCNNERRYSVGANSVTVRDEGSFYTDGHFDFCPGAGAGQLMLDFVDYKYLCDPNHTAELDPAIPRYELRIILTIGTAPEFNANGAYPTMKPYEAMAADCQVGGAPAIAQWVHYSGNGTTTPDSVQTAGSGSVVITQFDPTRVKPLIGSFELHFGGDTVKDTFTLDACN
jgi:hypothetical protein